MLLLMILSFTDILINILDLEEYSWWEHKWKISSLPLANSKTADITWFVPWIQARADCLLNFILIGYMELKNYKDL